MGQAPGLILDLTQGLSQPSSQSKIIELLENQAVFLPQQVKWCIRIGGHESGVLLEVEAFVEGRSTELGRTVDTRAKLALYIAIRLVLVVVLANDQTEIPGQLDLLVSFALAPQSLPQIQAMKCELTHSEM